MVDDIDDKGDESSHSTDKLLEVSMATKGEPLTSVFRKGMDPLSPHDDDDDDDEPHSPLSLSRSSPSPSSSLSRISSKKSVLWNPLVLSILITETAERVAYFGFRAVLVLYFTQGLQFNDPTSVALCAATAGLSYFSPLLGAIMADSQWGRFQTIWRFGIMYAIGLVLLTWAAYAIPDNSDPSSDSDINTAAAAAAAADSASSTTIPPSTNLWFQRALTFLGLFLVCMGTGGIKPCVSAFGADQVVELDSPPDVATNNSNAAATLANKNEERIREFFNSFYFCINVGALGAFAFIPMVRAYWGFGASFLIPTVAMILALIIFRSQRDQYQHRKKPTNNEAEQPTLLEVLRVALRILRDRLYYTSSRIFRRRSRRHSSSTDSHGMPRMIMIPIHKTENHSHIRSVTSPTFRDHDDSDVMRRGRDQVYVDASQALHIMPLMAFFPMYWMLYDQQGSVWTLQATRMNLHGIEPEQLQFLNPLLIMIFIPLFEKHIYPWLESRGFNIQPLRRMEWGMFLTAISFVVSAIVERQIQSRAALAVSVWWQVPQITILTVAEILLNVTGLEFAYSQAPPAMQALVLAIYLFTTAIGDGLAAILFASIFAHMTDTTTMTVCAILMLLNLFAFSRVAAKWKPYNHIQIDHSTSMDDGLELGPMSGHSL